MSSAKLSAKPAAAPAPAPSAPLAVGRRAVRRKPAATTTTARRTGRAERAERAERAKRKPPAPAPVNPPLWKKAWRDVDKPPAAAEAWALAHYREMFKEMSDKQVLGACRYDMRQAFRDEQWMRARDEEEGGADLATPLAVRQSEQIFVQMIRRARRRWAEEDLADPEAAARRRRKMRAERERRWAAGGPDPQALQPAPALARDAA